jgi:hypothetical protein
MTAEIVFDDQITFVTDPVTPCAGVDFTVNWQDINIGDETSSSYTDSFDLDDLGSGDSAGLDCDPLEPGESALRTLTFNLPAGTYVMTLFIDGFGPYTLGDVIIEDCFDTAEERASKRKELPPVDLPDPATFQAEVGEVEPLEKVKNGVATDLGWEFCLRYNGRPWQTVYFTADSASEAAAWIVAYTRFVNETLVLQGYAPLCTWVIGACPPH